MAGATDLESTNAFANSAAAVTLLGRLITENGGTVRLIGTWGDQDGDKDHHDFSPNFATMQAHLDRGFTRYLDALAGAGVPAEIIPIGAAWTFAKSGAFVNGDDDDNDDDDEHGDTLFSKLYKRDGAHPSVHGTYLAACVAFANILHSSPVGIEWAPEKISERDKLMLQQYAEAVTTPPPLMPQPPALPPRQPPFLPPPISPPPQGPCQPPEPLPLHPPPPLPPPPAASPPPVVPEMALQSASTLAPALSRTGEVDVSARMVASAIASALLIAAALSVGLVWNQGSRGRYAAAPRHDWIMRRAWSKAPCQVEVPFAESADEGKLPPLEELVASEGQCQAMDEAHCDCDEPHETIDTEGVIAHCGSVGVANENVSVPDVADGEDEEPRYPAECRSTLSELDARALEAEDEEASDFVL